MRLERLQVTDVLVLGSGLAGLSAAVAAAERGRRVTLACAGARFSGSSFYPGTWGLGLVGPDGPADESDLIETIERVGCGMTVRPLVETLVRGVGPAVEELCARGVRLRRAANADEREFIPCFDHKHRCWSGLEVPSVREMFARRIEELGIRVLAATEAVQLVRTSSGHVAGAVLAGVAPAGTVLAGSMLAGAAGSGGSREPELLYVAARSTVLATGGYGTLFSHRLCTADVEGTGQALAMAAGCTLTNMEFMQMMPGYLEPAYGTVFNEKAFRFTRLARQDGSPVLGGGGSHVAALLDQRSGYGPFTSRLASREVDLAIFREQRSTGRGVRACYDDEVRSNPPEFVRVYFDWLREAKGVTPDDAFELAMFAHAANGGVRIDEAAWTGVSGLFAAGEVTGGMHGADRLGGLSSANCLVFGSIAGRSAAEACEDAPEPPRSCSLDAWAWDAETVRAATAALQAEMSANAMVIRSERGLGHALARVRELAGSPRVSTVPGTRGIVQSLRLAARLACAEAVLEAALLRRESRGSHYREDHPEQSASLARRIEVRLGSDGHPRAVFA